MFNPERILNKKLQDMLVLKCGIMGFLVFLTSIFCLQANAQRLSNPAEVYRLNTVYVYVSSRDTGRELTWGSGAAQRAAIGSGVLFSKEGHVLTAKHVMGSYSPADHRIMVRIGGPNSAFAPQEAELLKCEQDEQLRPDDQVDICLLKILGGLAGITAVEVYPCISHRALSVGELLWAQGWSAGSTVLNMPPAGAVSAEAGRAQRYMTSVVALPGMSGGPFYDASGRLVALLKGGVATGVQNLVSPLFTATAIRNLLPETDCRVGEVIRDRLSIWGFVRMWDSGGRPRAPAEGEVVVRVRFPNEEGEWSDPAEPQPEPTGFFTVPCPPDFPAHRKARVKPVPLGDESSYIGRLTYISCSAAPREVGLSRSSELVEREFRLTERQRYAEQHLSDARSAELEFRNTWPCDRTGTLELLFCRQRAPPSSERDIKGKNILTHYSEAAQASNGERRRAILLLFGRFQNFIGNPCSASENLTNTLVEANGSIAGAALSQVVSEWADTVQACAYLQGRLDQFSREQRPQPSPAELWAMRQSATADAYQRLLRVSESSSSDQLRESRLRRFDLWVKVTAVIANRTLDSKTIEKAITENIDLLVNWNALIKQFTSEQCWDGEQSVADQPIDVQITIVKRGCR